MKVGIPKEILPEERRVAAVPETVAAMVKQGMDVIVQSSAGSYAHIKDSDYEAAGAKIERGTQSLFNQADVVLKVHRPIFDSITGVHELDYMKEQAILIGPLFPTRYPDLIEKLNVKKISAFSLDLLPRIARAQSMDIISSMSNIAGYKSVIMAADYLGKLFPMMTTAAGTIKPAKVIVIGAGVAGLQAIATARRLGGIVIAFDTRPIVCEQVKSLGAQFVALSSSHTLSQDERGYAKTQSLEFYKSEQDIIHTYLTEADVVITTALIPGKRAPLLITEGMIKEMKQGAVIIDLAIEQEGNCELTEPGKVVVKYGITIAGPLNIASSVPMHASQLYAKNMLAFLNHIAPHQKVIPFDQADEIDEIISSCLITHNGKCIYQSKQMIETQQEHHGT